MTTDCETQEKLLRLLMLRLRALVLALGESSTPAWWKTEFMNEAGLRFLERLYPRTPYHAAVYAAGKAASDAHDRAVGRIGVYHLFRLPEFLETEIHRMSPDLYDEFFTSLRDSLSKPEILMELLAPLCGEAIVDATPGARKMGNDKDIFTLKSLQETAAVYYQAFTQKKPCFPYFTVDLVGGRE